jgi:hypothetical protein
MRKLETFDEIVEKFDANPVAFLEGILPGRYECVTEPHCVTCPVSHLTKKQLAHHIDRLLRKNDGDHAGLLDLYLKAKFEKQKWTRIGDLGLRVAPDARMAGSGDDALEIERKTFVRDYSLSLERRRQNYKPRKSKNPVEQRVREVIREVIEGSMSTDEWRLQFVRQAHYAWQKKLIRDYFRKWPVISYEDLKAYIAEQPWGRGWTPRKIAAFWRTLRWR